MADSYSISEDTAREALKSLAAQHYSRPDDVLVELRIGGELVETAGGECVHGYGCGLGSLGECDCPIARAWRELAKLLGER